MSAPGAGPETGPVRAALETILDEGDGSIDIPTPTKAFAREIATAIEPTTSASESPARARALAGACLYDAIVATEAPLFEPDIERLTGLPIDRIRPFVATVAALYLDEIDASDHAVDGYEHDPADSYQLTELEKRWELALLVDADAGAGSGGGTGADADGTLPDEDDPKASAGNTHLSAPLSASPSFVERVKRTISEWIRGLSSDSRWRCPNCGHPIPHGDGVFCPECGTNAARAFESASESGNDDEDEHGNGHEHEHDHPRDRDQEGGL